MTRISLAPGDALHRIGAAAAAHAPVCIGALRSKVGAHPHARVALAYPTNAAMATRNIIDNLQAKLSELFAASPAHDVQRNLRAALMSALARLDLVTREEFDVQAKVLARTREKLTALEAKVAELEALMQQRHP